MRDYRDLLGFRVMPGGKEPGAVWHLGWGKAGLQPRASFVLERIFCDISGWAVECEPKKFSVALRLTAHIVNAWPSLDDTVPGCAIWRDYETYLPAAAASVYGFSGITLGSLQSGNVAGLNIELALNDFHRREFGLTCSACGLFGLANFTLGYVLGAGAAAG